MEHQPCRLDSKLEPVGARRVVDGLLASWYEFSFYSQWQLDLTTKGSRTYLPYCYERKSTTRAGVERPDRACHQGGCFGSVQFTVDNRFRFTVDVGRNIMEYVE